MGLTFAEGPRVEMDRLMRLAVRSGVTLHFVDRNPVPNVDQSARLGAAFQPGGERPVAGAPAAAQADIEEIARNTGGVLVETLDVYEGLSRAMELERGAYMLGYYLDRDLPDDERALLERLAFIGADDDLEAAIDEARREVETRLRRLRPGSR